MGFFDEASSLFNRGVANAGRGTRSLAIKVQLGDLKKQREGLCRQLGAGLYEQARHMPELREPLEALFASIEALDTQSTTLQHELDAIEEQARLAQAASARRCPSCGAPLGPDDQFCVGCGARVIPSVSAPMPAPAPTSFCRSCGAALAEGERFCVACGQPIAQPAAAPDVEEPTAGGLDAQEPATTDEPTPSAEPAEEVGRASCAEPAEPAAESAEPAQAIEPAEAAEPAAEPEAADKPAAEPDASEPAALEPAAPSGSTAPLPPVPAAAPTAPLPPTPAAPPTPVPPAPADATQVLYVHPPVTAPASAPIGQRAAICGNCGYENVPDAVFCRNCGHRI